MTNGNGTTIRIVVGAAATTLLALLGFTLTWLVKANAEIKVLQHNVQDIAADVEADIRRDEALSKHWKLHGWAKDEINALRHEHQKGQGQWPDL